MLEIHAIPQNTEGMYYTLDNGDQLPYSLVNLADKLDQIGIDPIVFLDYREELISIGVPAEKADRLITDKMQDEYRNYLFSGKHSEIIN